MARHSVLSRKQAAFVEEYLSNGGNASAAYRKVYACSNMLEPTINRAACVLLQNYKISAIISRAEAKAEKRIEAVMDRYAVSKERISAELARMAFADSRKLFKWSPDGVAIRSSDDLTDDEAAAVVEVSETKSADGGTGTIRVKLGDKRGALMDLAKLHGYIVERRDLRVIRQVEDLSDEELAALAATGDREREGTRH